MASPKRYGAGYDSYIDDISLQTNRSSHVNVKEKGREDQTLNHFSNGSHRLDLSPPTISIGTNPTERSKTSIIQCCLLPIPKLSMINAISVPNSDFNPDSKGSRYLLYLGTSEVVMQPLLHNPL